MDILPRSVLTGPARSAAFVAQNKLDQLRVAQQNAAVEARMNALTEQGKSIFHAQQQQVIAAQIQQGFQGLQNAVGNLSANVHAIGSLSSELEISALLPSFVAAHPAVFTDPVLSLYNAAQQAQITTQVQEQTETVAKSAAPIPITVSQHSHTPERQTQEQPAQEESKPFSLPSALPDPASTKNPILAHTYAIGRGIEKGRDVVANTVLHPIDTTCSTVQTIWDGYNAIADVTFGVSTESARFRNAARGAAVVDATEAFVRADSVKRTEVVAQFVSTGIFGAAVGGVIRGTAVYSLEKAGFAIETKYGHVFQSLSPSALKLRTSITNSSTLYRAVKTGFSEGVEGQFWALEKPGLYVTYAQRYGVPSKNIPFDFIQSGKLPLRPKFITRYAAPFGSNPGGAMEVVVNRNTMLPYVLDTTPTISPQIIGGRSVLSQYSQFLTPPILSSEFTAGAIIAIATDKTARQPTERPE